MADLRLPQLPDRTSVKLSLVLTPELNRSLAQYADLYAETYGSKESVSDLIPFMLQTFLDGDRAFARTRSKTS